MLKYSSASLLIANYLVNASITAYRRRADPTGPARKSRSERWETKLHFAGVDVPIELVQAHADGNVVFFVGAGASAAPPTKLPLFGGLTKIIADMTGTAYDPQDLEQPDVFLGALDARHDVDVHSLVAQEIQRRKKRNVAHDAIADLASASGAVRIVTTNYDMFLSQALRSKGLTHRIYEAPALPFGDDFSGVVHLHGRLGQPPRQLVVTDRDFGAAYITRGWASGFLRALFSRFVVCFIGYSHNDRMMEYLAKGLPSDAQPRFIFADDRTSSRWQPLGVTPVYYPSGEHAVLTEALGRWGTWARDTPLARAERVRSLAGAEPPADPDDQDFLLQSLNHPHLIGKICQIADNSAWTQWILEQATFDALLQTRSSEHLDGVVEGTLAAWFARAAVQGATFELAHRRAASIAGWARPSVVVAILAALAHEGVDPDKRSAWLRWSLTSGDPTDARVMTAMADLWSNGTVDLDDSETMLLLDYLTSSWRPRGNTPLGGTDIPDLTLQEESALREGATRRLATPELVRALTVWAGAFFEDAHRRVTNINSIYDAWNFSRSSIATHEQNEYTLHETADVIIDLTRNALAALAQQDGRASRCFVRLWASSPAPILRRLALDALRADQYTIEDVVALPLADRNLLFDSEVHHEIYALVAHSAPRLSGRDLDELVAQVCAGPAEPRTSDAEYRDRLVYELLHWILERRDHAPAESALREIEARHPEWIPRNHPDFEIYSSGAVMTSSSDEHPWPPEVFHVMIVSDVENAIFQLTQAVASTDRRLSTDDRLWWGPGDMVSKTVERWPEDGFKLWNSTDSAQVRSRVIEGWGRAALSSTEIDESLALLLSADLTNLGRTAVRFLIPWTNEQDARAKLALHPMARKLARSLAEAVGELPSAVRDGNLMTAAINSPIGAMAEYWLEAAAQEARSGKYPGGGLSREVQDALQNLLACGPSGTFARATMLGRLLFLYRVDPEWAKTHLLQQIDPTLNPWESIEPLWEVVLKGQVGEDLLDAGIRDQLVQCAMISGEDSPLLRDLARVLAIVAIRSTVNDKARLAWIRQFVAVDNERLRARWTGQVGRFLKDLEPDARGSLWTRWIRAYISDRVSGRPRSLTPEEVAKLIDWIAGLPSDRDFAEAATMLVRAGVGIAGPSDGGWSTFSFSQAMVESRPQIWAGFLTRLLAQTQSLNGSHGIKYGLQQAHSWLAEASPDALEVRALHEELFRLDPGAT